MELLDSDVPFKQEGKNFTLFGVISFIIAAMAGIIVLVGGYQSYFSLHTEGAPDAKMLGRAIRFISFGSLVQMLTVILGLVLCLMAFSKKYHTLLSWRIILGCNIIIFFSGFMSIIPLILAGVMIGHLIMKKRFYFEEINV